MAKPQKSVPRTINKHFLIDSFDDGSIKVYVLTKDKNVKQYYTDKASAEAEELLKALGEL